MNTQVACIKCIHNYSIKINAALTPAPLFLSGTEYICANSASVGPFFFGFFSVTA